MRNILTINNSGFPEALKTIPSPPTQLFVEGDNLDALLARPRVAIVGSRKVTAYGRSVTTKLASELAQRGVVIVSGLALGVDAIAHRAALDAGGTAIAVLPSGLDTIAPSTNRDLARSIVRQGGALVSEYPDGTPVFKGNFVARNRLVSGISDVLVITEASEGSGTLHTAQFARKQGRPIFVVPGNITSPESRGTNKLIKEGANILLAISDILKALHLDNPASDSRKPTSENPNEQAIIDLIAGGISDGGELLASSGLPVQQFNQSLTMLEITGTITNDGNNQWSL